MKLALSFLTLILTGTGAAAQTPPPAQTAVQQASKQWFDAFLRGDGATMDRLEAPDLTLVFQDGSFYQKTEPRAKTAKARTPDRTWGAEAPLVRVAGDTAVYSFLHVAKMKTGETVRTRTTEVWRQTNGAWRILAAHWTDVTGK
jgi:ketosteroid isomerase-like protein